MGWILIKISLKFVPKGPINNIPALFQIMAWRLPGNTSLSEPMIILLIMHSIVKQVAIRKGHERQISSVPWNFEILLSPMTNQLNGCPHFFVFLFFLKLIIPRAKQSCWGVYWFHSVRSSVCPPCIPCPLWSDYSSCWIHFISIHLIKQLQRVCHVWSFLQNFKIGIFGNFLKFVTLTLSCFDLGPDVITSMGNHRAAAPPLWWLVTVVTLSVNRGPESSLTVLYCGIPIRVRSVVVVRLLCWEYTLIKLRLLVLVISTNGYNSYFNIGVVAASWILVSSRLWRSVYSIPPVIASGWQADTV